MAKKLEGNPKGGETHKVFWRAYLIIIIIILIIVIIVIIMMTRVWVHTLNFDGSVPLSHGWDFLFNWLTLR